MTRRLHYRCRYRPWLCILWGRAGRADRVRGERQHLLQTFPGVHAGGWRLSTVDLIGLQGREVVCQLVDDLVISVQSL